MGGHRDPKTVRNHDHHRENMDLNAVNFLSCDEPQAEEARRSEGDGSRAYPGRRAWETASSPPRFPLTAILTSHSGLICGLIPVGVGAAKPVPAPCVSG